MHIAPRVLASAAVAACMLSATTHAQTQIDPWQDRYDRGGRYDAYSRLAELDPGTFVTVRTREPIETSRRDNRVYIAVVENDVWDQYSRLAIPAIPRGAPAELFVRSAPDGDLILDLDSITVEGRRYAVSARTDRVETNRPRATSGDRAAEYIGGGALLGTIVGAIAGGGKGAAIGAAAGAGVGAAVMTQGRTVRVPAGSQLTFRLDRPLTIDVRDDRPWRRDRR